MLLKYLWMGLLMPLVACSVVPQTDAERDDGAPVAQVSQNAWTQVPLAETGASALGWRHYSLPGKAASEYDYTRQDGRDAMAAFAQSSASLLRQTVQIAPHELGRIRFSWKVPELMTEADMALRDAEDSSVRIVLAFDGDRSKFSAKNAMLSELTHVLTGEPMPYATLMYVWCNTREPGSVIINPRTDRIRQVVVESGGQNLNQWLDYERDIRADYEKAFGEPPGALVGIGIMTDSDNTRSTTRAWYGPLRLMTPVMATTQALRDARGEPMGAVN